MSVPAAGAYKDRRMAAQVKAARREQAV